nr:hypothetical chloroplast RF21 [Ipomoea trifida]
MHKKKDDMFVDERSKRIAIFLYEKYESEFEEGALDPNLDPQQIEEDLFNHIVWAPRIWRPWGFLCIERRHNAATQEA